MLILLALNAHDRNIQMLGTVLLLSVVDLFIIFLASFVLSFSRAIIFFIGFEFLPLIVCLSAVFWDILSDKFTMNRSKDLVYPSCEGLAVIFLFVGFAALVSITIMVGAISSFIVGFTFAFAFFLSYFVYFS